MVGLQSSVCDLVGATQGAAIVINADKAVEHNRVIAVIDELREIAEAALGIATEHP
ncbi:MAG: hypothetical protein O3A14_01945 [Cyanobacteria bacterium]|nr:hypothetical protein [Cyanobacteriota bacterium]